MISGDLVEGCCGGGDVKGIGAHLFFKYILESWMKAGDETIISRLLEDGGRLASGIEALI